ncbi:MAG: hypothetical protein H6706_22620 [Myxococcales bacterium]|nr:hypothetical protein [Myxococcales bacterium]
MSPTTPTDAPENRGARILARSLLRRLKAQGFSEAQILAFATELRGLVRPA